MMKVSKVVLEIKKEILNKELQKTEDEIKKLYIQIIEMAY